MNHLDTTVAPDLCPQEVRDRVAALQMEICRWLLVGLHTPAEVPEDSLLTRKEVAFGLGTGRHTVWRMEMRGLIFIRGKVRLFALADFLIRQEMARRNCRNNGIKHHE